VKNTENVNSIRTHLEEDAVLESRQQSPSNPGHKFRKLSGAFSNASKKPIQVIDKPDERGWAFQEEPRDGSIDVDISFGPKD
jgi:hypothetical protein